jgi:hypothetical protein
MRVCCQMAHRALFGVHRTVSGAPSPRANKPATLGNFMGTIRYNSPDCPVCTGLSDEPAKERLPVRQRSTTEVYSDEQCCAGVRAAKSEVIGLSGAAKGQRVRTVNSSKPQRARWRGAHRTVNSGCPLRHWTVRCVHRQQEQPTARKWLGDINTHQPPHSKQSKYYKLPIQYKSKANHSKTHSKQSTPSFQNQL